MTTSANSHIVRFADLRYLIMLRKLRMTALGKLHRNGAATHECRLRAVHVGRGEVVQDRCDAANGSKEPILKLSLDASSQF